jgi:glycosyltransferase involved in cell wall biosynthesis
LVKSVSVVMTAYNRANLLAVTLKSIRDQQFKDYEIIVVQDDDGSEKTSLGVPAEGATEKVCAYFGVDKFIRRMRQAKATFSNPAVPNNIGLKAAEGDVIILQNAECRHISNEAIWNLWHQVRLTDGVAFAAVRSLDIGGQPSTWYTHPAERPKPYFFCGALYNNDVLRIRGFDEDYTEVGYDDDDFGDRLKHTGVPITYLDPHTVYVEHMWHPSSYTNMPTNLELYQNKTVGMATGEISAVRNLDRDWGVC